MFCWVFSQYHTSLSPLCQRTAHSTSKLAMKHFIIADADNVCASFLFLILISGFQCAASRHDNICGNSNGRRLYLELGERGTLTAENVTSFSSSRFHQTVQGNLTSHEQCSLELVTCPACVISITFRHLDLPHNCGGSNMLMDSPCRCDYVWLSEPPYEDVSGLPFCGLLASTPSSGVEPLSYRSQTRSLAITLLYSEAHRHAFTLEYTAERNRQFLKGSPAGGAFSVASNNVSHSGMLKSPFFPAQYPRDLGIEYVINCLPELSPNMNSSCRVRVVFRDFQLASVSIMEFYDWNGHRLDVSSGTLFRPPVIISTGPSLLVRFYANGGTGLGFKAIYSFVSDNFQESSLMPVTDCGGYVENLGGAITMMHMVDRGLKTYDCIWLIRPPKNYLHLRTHLYLKVATFRDMAGSTELQIRQGLTSDKPILDTIRHPASQLQSSRHREHIVPVNVGFYVSLRGTFGALSRLAIVYAAFNYMDCFAGSDYLCQNHRCIPSQLSCDGFDHCGDNSDEPTTCYQEWDVEPQDRRWYSHTPNYYFPKNERYPDLKTATLVFVISSLGLVLLISALIVLLYRMGARARQQRDIQNRLQTISELLDGARVEEVITADDPPVYEAPPDYDEVIKVFLEPSASNRLRKKRTPRRSHSSRLSLSREEDSSGSSDVTRSEQHHNHLNGTILEVALPPPLTACSTPAIRHIPSAIHNQSIINRSCQTTPVPDSPPPPYTDNSSIPAVHHSPTSQLSSRLNNPERMSKRTGGQASWLLFREDNSDEQLLSVVVTGVSTPQEAVELAQGADQEVQVSEGSNSADSVTSTEAASASSDNNGASSSSHAITENTSTTPKQTTLKIGNSYICKGTILQVQELPGAFISFDDIIAERLFQAASETRNIENISPSVKQGTKYKRRYSSQTVLDQQTSMSADSSSDSETETSCEYKIHSRASEKEYLYRRRIIADERNIYQLAKDRSAAIIRGISVNDAPTATTTTQSCNCEGACGCASIVRPRIKPTRRKRHHIRSLSAGFPVTVSATSKSTSRALDIYFSQHEVGIKPIAPKPPTQTNSGASTSSAVNSAVDDLPSEQSQNNVRNSQSGIVMIPSVSNIQHRRDVF